MKSLAAVFFLCFNPVPRHYFDIDQVTTIDVHGPWKYKVTSPHASVNFVNVRFDIWDESKFVLNLGTATFYDTHHTVTTRFVERCIADIKQDVWVATVVLFLRSGRVHGSSGVRV